MNYKKTKNKVCILGTASSLGTAPFNDDSYEFWGCSPVITKEEVKGKKIDLLFELHDHIYWGQDAVALRLNEFDGPIFMKEKGTLIKNSVKFPLEEMITYFEKYLGVRYHTSTISYMLAYAIFMGFKQIDIFGVHMSAEEEYGFQRQACEYWIGIAESKGIKVGISESSEILHNAYMYGYEMENDIVNQCRMRAEGLNQGIILFQNKKLEKLVEVNQLIGKYSIEPTDERLKRIKELEAEMVSIQSQIDKNQGAKIEDEHWIRKYSFGNK